MSDITEADEQGMITAARASMNEWTTAALAHASVVLAFVVGAAGGVGAFAGPAVALAIYLGYRGKSRFIALHALQACVYQAVGILIFITLAAVLGAELAIAWTISGILSVVLIGLVLVPFALLLTLLVVLLLIVTPFLWAGYGLYAAYKVYHGQDFRYRWIGDWVEREVKLYCP